MYPLYNCVHVTELLYNWVTVNYQCSSCTCGIPSAPAIRTCYVVMYRYTATLLVTLTTNAPISSTNVSANLTVTLPTHLLPNKSVPVPY